MMKTIRYGIAVLLLAAICAVSQTSRSDKDRLIGAWHLVTLSGPDGKPLAAADLPVGMLIYTRDGHMSVQLMYPKAAANLSNEYVRNGYEASFGIFDLNEAAHTVTHHLQGANTGDVLVGKDLPRIYQFTPDGRLTIRSTRADEHWSVIWAHY
jgi:hypothetical protein